MAERIRVVAGAVVVDGQLLAVRRGPQMRLAGLWELAGGKVEPGESDPDALARELQEELGIDVVVGPHLAEADHDYTSARIVLAAYGCSLRAGEPTLSEHDALRWLTADTLHSVAWAPADVPLLDAVAEWMQA